MTTATAALFIPLSIRIRNSAICEGDPQTAGSRLTCSAVHRRARYVHPGTVQVSAIVAETATATETAAAETAATAEYAAAETAATAETTATAETAAAANCDIHCRIAVARDVHCVVVYS
jgi:hypothetical protein